MLREIEQFLKVFDLRLPEKLSDTSKISMFSQKVFYNREQGTYYGGEFLGTITKSTKQFTPSMFFVSTYLQNGPKIIIDGKQEWLFICGRDVFLKDVRNGYYVVFDTQQNILGYGKVSKDILYNKLDIGVFLRQEMQKGRS